MPLAPAPTSAMYALVLMPACVCVAGTADRLPTALEIRDWNISLMFSQRLVVEWPVPSSACPHPHVFPACARHVHAIMMALADRRTVLAASQAASRRKLGPRRRPKRRGTARTSRRTPCLMWVAPGPSWRSAYDLLQRFACGKVGTIACVLTGPAEPMSMTGLSTAKHRLPCYAVWPCLCVM